MNSEAYTYITLIKLAILYILSRATIPTVIFISTALGSMFSLLRYHLFVPETQGTANVQSSWLTQYPRVYWPSAMLIARIALSMIV